MRGRYHLLSRGDRREDIVFDDEDRKHFVETLGEAATRANLQVHASCLSLLTVKHLKQNRSQIFNRGRPSFVYATAEQLANKEPFKTLKSRHMRCDKLKAKQRLSEALARH